MSVKPERCPVCGLVLWTGKDAKYDPCQRDHVPTSASKKGGG